MPDAAIDTPPAPPATGFREYFAGVFTYDRWANTLVLDAMAGLGEHLPPKPLDRMSHLTICQQLWLSRMTDDVEKPATIFPTWTLDETRRQATTIFERMRRFIDELPEADFRGSFSFRTLEGEPYTLIRRDILTQLSQHGPYHRGQIAMELNPLLPEPLVTDYVYYAWRKA